MSKINKNLFTIEMSEVYSYMEDKLANEFPTDLLTPEYLMLAILDTRNCHANLILDNCLMSNNLEELREIYADVQIISKYDGSERTKIPFFQLLSIAFENYCKQDRCGKV